MLRPLPGTETRIQNVRLLERADVTPFAALGAALVTEDIQTLAQPSLPEVSRAMTRWCFRLQASGEPLIIQRVSLDAEAVGADMLQMLSTDAILAYDIPADVVMPLYAVGRTVITEYTPHRRVDPPVPLMSLFDFSRETFGYHASAIKLVLNGNATGVIQAVRLVMRDALQAEMTREELFAYLNAMLSLSTGSYQQRYDTGHVLPAR